MNLDDLDTDRLLEITDHSLFLYQQITGALPSIAPVDAIDLALGGDPNFRRCEQSIQNAIATLLPQLDHDGAQVLLGIEPAHNQAVAGAADFGWRLGVVARSKARS